MSKSDAEDSSLVKAVLSMPASAQEHFAVGTLLAREPESKEVAESILRESKNISAIRSILNTVHAAKLKLPRDSVSQFLNYESDLQVKCEALKALGFLAGPTEFDTYFKALESGEDELILAAIEAFKWSPRSSLGWLLDQTQSGAVKNFDAVGQCVNELGVVVAARDASPIVVEIETEEAETEESGLESKRIRPVTSAEYYPDNGSSSRDKIKVYGRMFWDDDGNNDNSDMITSDRNNTPNTWRDARAMYHHSRTYYRGRVYSRHTAAQTRVHVDVRLSDGSWDDGIGSRIQR